LLLAINQIQTPKALAHRHGQLIQISKMEYREGTRQRSYSNVINVFTIFLIIHSIEELN